MRSFFLVLIFGSRFKTPAGFGKIVYEGELVVGTMHTPVVVKAVSLGKWTTIRS
jgi:hypothetical protein